MLCAWGPKVRGVGGLGELFGSREDVSRGADLERWIGMGSVIVTVALE
jgi:hypothetical protein